MTPYERPNRSTAEPNAWWQRVLAGERLPKRLSRHPKCEGTVEDHRAIALDVRELIRKRVFEQPVGSAFRLNIAFPWLRVMRLNSSSLDLELITGRTVVVPLVWAHCGVMGERRRLECPLCGQRVCALYYLEPRLACRRCNGLWYAAQGTSSTARKLSTGRGISSLWGVQFSPLGGYGDQPFERSAPPVFGGRPRRLIGAVDD